ncbi:MAG: Fic family protein [Alphaproteobacteria bacterium]|nr:Fic family protein [Alphaproteobacteria bacterium]
MLNATASTRLGKYVIFKSGEETVRAFVPPPLPPDPPLDLTPFHGLLDRATLALGRLDGLSTLLPDTSLFLYFYVRKEAIVSSQIEGTKSSLSDLLMYENQEAPNVSLDDVREVSNYIAAMEHGLKRMEDGFPLSLRLIKEMHSILLQDGRGAEKEPGEFRRSQNWWGGTRPGNAIYVPPPPDEIMPCMGALELFFHDDKARLPLLVRAALVHVQFETIHPFLDGNGRLGRLLVTLMLCADKALKEPLLYLSLYLKTHRDAYYDLLQKVRKEGAWEGWLEFFLNGVVDTATQAADAATSILSLFKVDRDSLTSAGRGAASAMRVHEAMQTKPITTIASLKNATGLTIPTISTALEELIKLGIVREITGRKRGRLFMYGSYFKILSDGTEPLPLTKG